jgi:hypothetical protein
MRVEAPWALYLEHDMRRKDRRSSQREACRLRARFWRDGIEGTGFTHDISDTGVLIETTHPLTVNQRLHLEFEIGDDAFYTEAVVARKKVYPRQAQSVFRSAAGLRFVRLREAVRLHAEAVPEEKPEETPVAEQTPEEAPEETPEHPPAKEPQDLAVEIDLREPEALARVYEREIRHGGLSVDLPGTPEVDTEIPVTLWLPSPHGTIRIRGNVVKANEEGGTAYLSLLDLDPIRRRLLEILEILDAVEGAAPQS